MRGRWVLALLAWLILAGTVHADGEFTAGLAQIDTSSYPEITLYVSIRDQAGQIVGGLPQTAFTITEDGTPVDIIDFSAGIQSAISTVLTIDRSGSMDVENKMAGAKSAATTFVDLMRAQDKAALVAFNQDVVTIQSFTSDKAILQRKIQSMSPGGCTAWYDGVYQSVNLVATLEGRRSVILLSDGIDCREDWMSRLLGEGSSYSLDEAIQYARDADLPVYTIGLGQRATQEVSNEGFDEVKLQRVARETGGTFHHAPNADELKQLYRTLSIEMQKEYALTYRSPRPTYDGTRRNIVVTVQQGAGGAGVSTGGGYLERHLINIRSDLGLFLAFLAPLLLLLTAPTLISRAGERASRPRDGVTEGPGSVGVREHGGAGVEESVRRADGRTPAQKAMPPAQLIAQFPFTQEGISIGQATSNDVVIKHPSVAPQHACIFRQDKWFAVHSLGAGQTFVSFSGDPAQERLVTQNALKDGSTVRFGDVRCGVRLAPEGTGGHIRVSYSLPGEVTTIGRDGTNDIVVNAAGVAPRQAEIRWEQGRFVVSSVGDGEAPAVSFSGDPSQERPVQGRNALKPGSTLRVGNVVFKLAELKEREELGGTNT